MQDEIKNIHRIGTVFGIDILADFKGISDQEMRKVLVERLIKFLNPMEEAKSFFAKLKDLWKRN